jgi:hypothetical protein
LAKLSKYWKISLLLEYTPVQSSFGSKLQV